MEDLFHVKYIDIKVKTFKYIHCRKLAWFPSDFIALMSVMMKLIIKVQINKTIVSSLILCGFSENLQFNDM